jgi:hypothetical protein
MISPVPRRSPTRASLGTASLSTSSLLVLNSADKLASPVTLPPGRARLANPTYVRRVRHHDGMEVVAFAANADGVFTVTIN